MYTDKKKRDFTDISSGHFTLCTFELDGFYTTHCITLYNTVYPVKLTTMYSTPVYNIVIYTDIESLCYAYWRMYSITSHQHLLGTKPCFF